MDVETVRQAGAMVKIMSERKDLIVKTDETPVRVCSCGL